MVHSNALKLAFASIGIGLLVLALKAYAYYITGSLALYSDALESIINVAAACAACLAIHWSAKPADANHPYGHHKAEYFSAVLEGGLIIAAAIFILLKAYEGLSNPPAITAPMEGLVLNGLATVINCLWAMLLIRFGRKHRSPALVADGKHLMTDVISSIGVALGLILAIATGWLFLDTVLAIFVAFNILISGYQLMRESFGGLMDAAPPEGELEAIRTIISETATGAIEAHDLRARHAGPATFIDFHLVVNRDMTVGDAHDICDLVEAALKREIPKAIITIHVEPPEKAKHTGIVVM